MAIRGSLREASLPDVLQLLAMGKKTGCLSVTHRNSFGYIYFDRGRIAYASIVNRRDRLGDLARYAGTLLHEVGHMVSGTPDGTLEFENELSRLLGVTATAALNSSRR